MHSGGEARFAKGCPPICARGVLMNQARCFCDDHPGGRFFGDDPLRVTEVEILEDNAVFPAILRVRCRSCAGEWRVEQIPYGGIYGDFDWRRVQAP